MKLIPLMESLAASQKVFTGFAFRFCHYYCNLTKIHLKDNERGCWSVLDVHNNILVASYASPTIANRLVSVSTSLDLVFC